jgi:hypothetical protein
MAQWFRRVGLGVGVALASVGFLAVALCWRVLDHDQASVEQVGGASNLEGLVLPLDRAEAEQFCDWLTEREQKSGLIGSEMRYCLPAEWHWDETNPSFRVIRGEVWINVQPSNQPR